MKLSQELLAAYQAQVTASTTWELMEAVQDLPSWHPLGEMVATELTNRAAALTAVKLTK